MTELTRLKSQIAIFAGHTLPPQTQSRVAAFLDKLSQIPIDAVHIADGNIISSLGQAQDIVDFAFEFANHKGTQDAAIVCGGSHSNSQILFCACHLGETIVLRTEFIEVDDVFQAWRSFG